MRLIRKTAERGGLRQAPFLFDRLPWSKSPRVWRKWVGFWFERQGSTASAYRVNVTVNPE
jgi:hypothetical protein